MTAAGLATGNPGSVWGCQDSASPLGDAIGGITLPASGAGGTYQNAVSGWSRFGISTASLNVRWSNNTGPDPGATSVAQLVLTTVAIPSTTRGIFQVSSSANPLWVTGTVTTGVMNLNCNGTIVSGSSNHANGAVHAFLLVYNRTAGSVTLYSDLEKIVGTYSAGVVKGSTAATGTGIGSNGTNSGSTSLAVYSAEFSGSAAELTSAQAKTLLTTMGFTGIPWS
jgi:hypothetical protein